MKKIDYLVKALPIASLFLILCSAIRLVIYYNSFNISITDYLQIEEYPTLFADDILNYLLIFGLGFIIEVLNPYTQFGEESIKALKPSTKNKKRNLLISIIIVLISICAVYLFYNDDKILKLDIIKLLFFIFLLISHRYCLYTSINFNYIGLITTAILVYTIFDAKIDSLKILKNKEKLKYCIYLENKVIETNDKIHYLGKSEKYVFLFDTSEKTSTILLMEEVKEIQVQELIK